jgi:hypothetical protein
MEDINTKYCTMCKSNVARLHPNYYGKQRGLCPGCFHMKAEWAKKIAVFKAMNVR